MSNAVGYIVWLVVIIFYWSPTIIGALSRKHNLGVIFAYNFFAFVLGIPWIMAWVKVAEKPQQPTVILQQPYGFGPPPGTYYGPPATPQPQGYWKGEHGPELRLPPREEP